METIIDFLEYFYLQAGVTGIALMLATLVFFLVQLRYFAGSYSRVVSFKGRSKRGPASDEGISVVVILANDYDYLDNILPKIMAQDHPRFELVVVELTTEPEFSDQLALVKARYPNITSTRMVDDSRMRISRKMAYNVGIKAASYENIILTTDSAQPTSDKWLSAMSKGFAHADVVLGYAGVEWRPGVSNAKMRCNRIMSSVRYLSSAIKGHPYRGTIHNLGFTRRLYFEHRGFGYLNMNLGEDDLFVQNIAGEDNTTVVISPDAGMREIPWGNMRWWRERYKFGRAAFPYYKPRARRYERTELMTRLLFYGLVAASAAVCPLYAGVWAGFLWLLRLIVVRRQMWRIRRRLGESGLGTAMMIYDITEPFSRIWLWFTSIVNPPKGVWR